MTTFQQFPLSESIQKSIAHMQITTPTEIQQKAIPLGLEGRDVLGSAQTGTGKTLAFAIPMIERCYQQKGTALVLAPTRELATQVMKVILELLGPSQKKQCVLLIGGACMRQQLRQLKTNPRFVVGTPGRINDHLGRKKLDLSNVSVLVMDETDRMLDLGFSEDIEKICKRCPKEKQVLMFSATWPAKIKNLSHNYCHDPVMVKVGPSSAPAANIDHKQIVKPSKKIFQTLTEELSEREGAVIVFVRTKLYADECADLLNDAGHHACALHGDHRQARRDRVIQQFRTKKFRILVATDVASRGLDIPDIEHIISIGPPQSPEDYIHRIGRTARAGRHGHALCLMTPSEERKWWMIDKLLNPGKKTSSNRPPQQSKQNPKRKQYSKPRGKSDNQPTFNGKKPFKKTFKKKRVAAAID